jgi:hypothetical protein
MSTTPKKACREINSSATWRFSRLESSSMVRFVADERAEPWLRSRLPWENGITTKYWDRSKTI